MRGAYPGELRMRVIHFVEGGGSRREAANNSAIAQISLSVRFIPKRGEPSAVAAY